MRSQRPATSGWSDQRWTSMGRECQGFSMSPIGHLSSRLGRKNLGSLPSAFYSLLIPIPFPLLALGSRGEEVRQRCFNEMGRPGRLRGSSSLCPTILRHNADGLSHSGRGQLCRGQVHHQEPRQSHPDYPKPLGQKRGRFGASRGSVALTSMAGKYWLGW